MKHVLFTLLMLFSISTSAGTSPTIISTGNGILDQLESISPTIEVLDKYQNTVILKADPDSLRKIEAYTTRQGKCGGYFIHRTVTDARKSITTSMRETTAGIYRVQNLELVKKLIPLVKEKNIRDSIISLSSFKNRYYTSSTGVEASKQVAQKWGRYTPTKLYNHARWKQPSVIATIKGSTFPDEVIIVGGHIDSTAGWFGGSSSRAPGADDNASGIATIGEVLRVLTEGKYKPQRTIQFMAYAAEEVGLRGSGAIAKDYKNRGVKVIGVMQLDMDNYKGSEKDIYLVTDYANKSQNEFLGKLIKAYVKVPYGTTTCGYACSDHASWHREGYPVVFPFETSKRESNSKIHTSRDLINVSGGNANHATNFAKLAIAYILELDSQGFNIRLK